MIQHSEDSGLHSIGLFSSFRGEGVTEHSNKTSVLCSFTDNPYILLCLQNILLIMEIALISIGESA